MSEIRIAIPDLDLNNALRLDGNLRNYEIGPFDDVVLDFSRMTNFDPLPMLMAGAIIKRFRYQYHDNTFSISGINGKSYAGTMGFFKYISESISVGKSPGEATGSSNYIPITPISIGCVEDGYFDAEKITPPYNSRFPEIPSDEEIKTYKLDYNSESFRDYHWSQLAILNSMKVEYSRSGQPGGYGDFGRYTFQSYFYAWKQLHPIDLKNIAIKRIFELGYDVEKHGKYDRNCTDRVGLRFQLGRKERIGKKYQWIALYELAAQVCDNYQMTVYDNDIGEPHQEYCKGSFEPDIRNIDPTVLVTPGFDNLHIDIAAFSYDIPNNSYEEWLADFSNTPAFEQCVKLQSGAHQYLLLTGEYDWKEAKRLGFRSYDLPRKDMWHQIRGYVVKNEYAESLICALSGVDFMGRWMPEAQSNSAMYNKEYYWSDAHTFFNNPYYCGLEWVNIDSDHLNCVFPEKVLIPVKQYYSERKGELNSLNSEIASIYWHKPCEEMYTKLQLKYLKGSNSAFVDGAGELVCFESSELIGNDTGFYIRYDKLLEFLKSSSYTFA